MNDINEVGSGVSSDRQTTEAREKAMEDDNAAPSSPPPAPACEQPQAIYDLPFTMRTIHLLEKADIHTLEQLARSTAPELLRIKGLSRKCLNEIVDVLSHLEPPRFLEPHLPPPVPALTALEQRMFDVLKRVEWASGNGLGCPECDAIPAVHEDTCSLGNVLRLVDLAATPKQKTHYLESAWSEYNVPLCPHCGSKAVYQSAELSDGSRVLQCGASAQEGEPPHFHTWVLNAQGQVA